MKHLRNSYFRLVFFLLSITWMASFSSCNKECFAAKGKGPLVSKTYTVEAFNAIHTSANTHVYLTQGTVPSVEVKGQQNILDILDVTVSDGELNIGFENHCGSLKYDQLQVYITMPDVASIRISGSGKVEATNLLLVDAIDLDISGSANLSASINASASITGNISGSGEMYLAGSCPLEKFTISGSGTFHAFGLQSHHAIINISGSGSAEINVSDQLDVTISGSGDVRYKGQPIIHSTISGSGKLTHVN